MYVFAPLSLSKYALIAHFKYEVDYELSRVTVRGIHGRVRESCSIVFLR